MSKSLKKILAIMIAMIASKSVLAAGSNWLIEEVGQVPVYKENAENPWVNLVLFTGGKGWWGNLASQNFLIRQMSSLVNAGANVYIFPNPSREKISFKYRISQEHAKRIEALVRKISTRNELPVILVGFSRGAVSVGKYETTYPGDIDGIALLSAIYKSDITRRNKFAMESIIGNQIHSRLLVLHHEQDQCKVTWPSSAKKFFDTLEEGVKTLVFLSGGRPTGRQCGPLHFHGFQGVEKTAVKALIDWARVD